MRGTDGQREDPPEPERPRQAVDHGGQSASHPVAGGHQGDGLGPVVRRCLLARLPPGPARSWRSRGTSQGEDGDEPPVAGAGGRNHREGQADGAGGDEHDPAAPKRSASPAGAARRGTASRRMASPMPSSSPGSPACSAREPLARVAEALGHVARGPSTAPNARSPSARPSGRAPRWPGRSSRGARRARVLFEGSITTAAPARGAAHRRGAQKAASSTTSSTRATPVALSMYQGHGPRTRRRVQFPGGVRRNM